MRNNLVILKRTVILPLILIYIAASGFSALAQTANADKTISAARNKVSRIQNKNNKNISVKLTDGSQVEGLLTSVNAESFDVVDKKSGKTVNVQFAQVKKVSDGGGLSLGSKIVIGAVAGTAAVIGVLALVLSAYD